MIGWINKTQEAAHRAEEDEEGTSRIIGTRLILANVKLLDIQDLVVGEVK